jgi:threonine dehydratase
VSGSLPPLPVTFADVEAAASRLYGPARRTPTLQNEALDALAGARLLIKAEPMQRTGSFKFRGAYNAIAALRPPAVVAFSSGNHAQGVAAAATLLKIPATIIMPADAPRIKLANTRALGAEVITYDRHRESREQIAAEVAARQNAVLIRPYDEPLVIAGQGTVGLELAEDAAALGLDLDAALVCCGGGGLIAGCAVALAARFPDAAIYAVEPAGFDDTARSLAAGRRVPHESRQATICDALMAPIPGEITFAVNQRLLRGGLSVTNAEVEQAMRLAFRHLKLVVEPGGAVALAAALTRKLPLQGTVGIVVSGGNVDPETFARIIAAPEPPS